MYERLTVLLKTLKVHIEAYCRMHRHVAPFKLISVSVSPALPTFAKQSLSQRAKGTSFINLNRVIER